MVGGCELGRWMVTVRLWGVSMWRSEGEPGLAGRNGGVMVLVEKGDDCVGSDTLSAEQKRKQVYVHNMYVCCLV